MSYDVTFYADVGGKESAPLVGGWRNYTANVSGMWFDAIGEPGLGELLDPEPVAEIILPQIEKGILNMRANPEKYRAMNPANGWGDYEGALAYLEWIAEGCRQWPKSRVHVWR